VVIGLVVCAAVAAQRGSPPVELLAMGDPGAAMLVLWLGMGPILASVTLGIPSLILIGALDGPLISWGAAGGSIGFFLVASALGAALLRERGFPE
jgi:hypothetical protein